MKGKIQRASIEPLLDYFDRLFPLNKEEQELVTEKFHSRLFRKRQYVLQEGRVHSILFCCPRLFEDV
jgi:hypothetical protein